MEFFLDSGIFISDFKVDLPPNETSDVDSEHISVIPDEKYHNKLSSKICADVRGACHRKPEARDVNGDYARTDRDTASRPTASDKEHRDTSSQMDASIATSLPVCAWNLKVR